MIKIANAVEEMFDSECFIAEILHEDLALGQIYQIDSGCQHTHLAHSVDALHLLKNAATGQFLVKNWHSIVFDEPLFANARLSEKFC